MTYEPNYLIDTYSYDSGYDAVIGGLGLSYLWGILLAFLALWVFTVLIRWKMFEKAGVAGWKSIIPIYGDYVEYTIVWEGKWYLFTLLAGALCGFVFLIPLLGPIVAVAAIVFLEIITVVFNIQEAKAFGQDNGFALGLMFIPFVYKFFLGFDQDIKYLGSQPSPKYFNFSSLKRPVNNPYAQPNSYQQAYSQQYYTPQPTTQPAPTTPDYNTNTAPTPRFDPETGLPL